MYSELFGYVELYCLLVFSFQCGVLIVEELFVCVVGQGYCVLVIIDECLLVGIVCVWQVVKVYGVVLIVGVEFQVEDGLKLVLLCIDQIVYVGLCQLIMICWWWVVKGEYCCLCDDLFGLFDGLLCLWLDWQLFVIDFELLCIGFDDWLWLVVELYCEYDDVCCLQQLWVFGECYCLFLVVSGDVYMYVCCCCVLQDILIVICYCCSVVEVGWCLFFNGECYLCLCIVLVQLYLFELLVEILCIVECCYFILEQLQYIYLCELVFEGYDLDSWLCVLVECGIWWCWKGGIEVK